MPRSSSSATLFENGKQYTHTQRSLASSHRSQQFGSHFIMYGTGTNMRWCALIDAGQSFRNFVGPPRRAIGESADAEFKVDRRWDDDVDDITSYSGDYPNGKSVAGATGGQVGRFSLLIRAFAHLIVLYWILTRLQSAKCRHSRVLLENERTCQLVR